MASGQGAGEQGSKGAGEGRGRREGFESRGQTEDLKGYIAFLVRRENLARERYGSES